MKKVALLIICMLHVVAIYAVRITVNGVIYDDNGSSTIHEGLYRNVTVVGVDSNFEGKLIIPKLPADFSNGLFYFRVTSVANRAFEGNAKITSVTLPNTVTSVGNYAFQGCTNLTEAIIPSGKIGYNAFEECTNLLSATLGADVTEMGSSVFLNCTNLTTVTIPCEKIGYGIFEGCANLSAVTLGASVTAFNDDIFYGCSALSSISVEEENTVYSSLDGVLYNKSRTELIRYPVGKTDNTFSIPNGVTGIAGYAFEGSNLSSIVIPESITTLGDWAMGNCLHLNSITIPRNITNISTSAFNNCIGLTAFEVVAENPAYSSSDGILYNKDKTAIVRYPPNKENVSFFMPTTVTEISRYTFRDCLHLPVIFVPENVTSIQAGAFAWSKIQSVTLSKNVNFINIYAFGMCSDLTDLSVSWDHPSEVTFAEMEYSSDDIFYEVNKNAVTLHVPPGTKDAYLASDVWKGFNIVDDGAEAGNNAQLLANLTVNSGTLSPTFNPGRYNYRVTVPASIENITLAATPVDGATVSGDGQKQLNTGENVFQMTAGMEEKSAVYTVIVTRMANDYLLESLRTTEITTGNLTITYLDLVTNSNVTVPVIDLYEVEYQLSTGNVSGDLPLHFDIENGRYTHDETVNVEANSIYTFTLNMNVNYREQGDISFITHFDVFGFPSYTTMDYVRHVCRVIASDNTNNEVLSTTTINNMVGSSVSNISVSSLTFVGESEITSVENVSINPAVNIYSAPIPGFVTVSGLQGNETLHFYNMNGSLLFSRKANGEAETIPVGHLPAGVYVMKLGNGEVLKWVKK